MGASPDTTVHDAVIGFYREQIGMRYQLDNLRRFDRFDGVPDAQAHALRDYFLEHIYPEVDQREVLDDALNRLRDILKSPRRLKPLMRAALASMWKLGPSLPAAVRAGVGVLDAYLESRKLERIMVEAAEERGLTAEDRENPATMLAIIGDIPEREVLKLVGNIMGLFNTLSNTKLLGTAVEFLTTCQGIMREHPDLYSEQELRGIALGKAVVEGGLDLFLQMDEATFPDVVRGIEEVELEWYRRVTGKA